MKSRAPCALHQAICGCITTLLLAACGSSGGSSPAPAAPPIASQPPPIVHKVAGLNFSPYLDGQDPSQGVHISENQLTTRMQLIAPLTNSIRTYSMTHGLESSGRVARNLGLEPTVGAFLSRNPSQNAQEVGNLVAAAMAGDTGGTVIVGSEVLERGDLSETALIKELREARQKLPASVQLAYADTAYQLLDHPRVVDHADVVFANIYPYFDGVPIDQATRHLDFIFSRLQAAVTPKEVVIGETGWPSAGVQRGGAVASLTNAATYFRSFVSWARAREVDYFYFEAFNEAWKTGEGTQGPHWGILDSSGNMKSGMSDGFADTSAGDTWTRPVPGGAGEASLQFLSVPARGSSDGLQGQLTGVDPALYRVAVYIHVNGLWYPKPSFASPSVYPAIDGTWSVAVVTASGDENAGRIAAYLLPVSYRVPSVSTGSTEVPAPIQAAAVARIEIERR